MNIGALRYLLPTVALLSTFPFIFYWFKQPLPTSPRRVTLVKIGRVIGGIVCVLGYLYVMGMYFIFAFGASMSGGGAGPYPLERLLPDLRATAILILLLPIAAVWLVKVERGTLGLWTFAIGAGFTSFWAGLGWLPAEMDWRFVAASTLLGGLCGMAAGFILSRMSQPQERPGKVLFWSAVGAASAAIGILSSWPGVERAMRRNYSHAPIETTPFSVDPGVMLALLSAVVVVWLSLSTLAAIATGYIKLGRTLPASGATPE
jgi:hypothetical protein